MALDIFGHVIEFVFGPIALALHIPELNLVAGDVGQILDLAVSGQVGAILDGLLGGEFAAGSKMLASLLGTLAWLAVVSAVFGEFAGLGEAGEMLELIE